MYFVYSFPMLETSNSGLDCFANKQGLHKTAKALAIPLFFFLIKEKQFSQMKKKSTDRAVFSLSRSNQ